MTWRAISARAYRLRLGAARRALARRACQVGAQRYDLDPGNGAERRQQVGAPADGLVRAQWSAASLGAGSIVSLGTVDINDRRAGIVDKTACERVLSSASSVATRVRGGELGTP
jgi:hypothetical protein